MNLSFQTIHQRCLELKDLKKILLVKRFFKSGPGEYGEGDIFFGINVPTTRKLALEFKELSQGEIKKLFLSPVHEERLIGIHILNGQFEMALKKNDIKLIEKLYKQYFSLRKRVNNWDLVDSSAPYITGKYFFHFNSSDLYQILDSKNLWERRIAILSMFYYIKNGQFALPLTVLEKRLFDDEDLIHKACGWMLRELGKRDEQVLKNFLEKFASVMPRTTLRYAIEKFSAKDKKYFMNL